jgi:hypothetical protein
LSWGKIAVYFLIFDEFSYNNCGVNFCLDATFNFFIHALKPCHNAKSQLYISIGIIHAMDTALQTNKKRIYGLAKLPSRDHFMQSLKIW